MVIIRPDPRLSRWLGELGLAVSVGPADAPPAAVGSRRLPVTSPFPFHRLRQVLAGLGVRAEHLTPRSEEGRAWQAILRRLEGAAVIDGEGDFDPQSPLLDGLESALDLHQAIEVLLVEHRLALMQVDLSAARSTWTAFSARLRHHLATEDELVGPRYRSRPPADGWPRGAAPEIFDNEHAKILSRLETLEAGLEDLTSASPSVGGLRVRCLSLLDRQKVLQDILEHHDLRERRFVYPHLEAVLPQEEKAGIIRALMAW